MEVTMEIQLIDGSRVQLTLEGAKKLYEVLHDLVGKREPVFALGCRCFSGCHHNPLPYKTWVSAMSATGTANPTTSWNG